MLTIYKYKLEMTSKQKLAIPGWIRFLDIQLQNEIPCLWAIVDVYVLEMSIFTVEIFGTGHPMLALHESYIGTYQLPRHEMVFHVFVEKIS